MPGRLVVGRHPAGAEPEHEAAVGHDVEQRGHPVDEHGMAVVVAEHAGLQPEPWSLRTAAAVSATIGSNV